MVVSSKYVPNRRDIVWLNFDPQSGREQKGLRPALIISPASYNRKTGLCIACPITSRIKGYSFEVILPEGLNISGAVLSDQVKSLDWKSRNAKLICTLDTLIYEEVAGKLETLIK